MIKLLFIFLTLCFTVFLSLSTSGQNCKIQYDNTSASAIKKQKIKEIKIFTADSKTPVYHYFFNTEACVQKLIHYDFYSNGTEPMQSEYFTEKNNTVRTFTKGRIKTTGYLPIEKEIEYYSGSGKLIKKITEENADLKKINIYQFDTLYPEKTDHSSYLIHPPTQDTINSVRNTFDLNTKLFILRTKTTNGWEETDKIITTYKNGKYDEVSIYKLGKLVNSYTRKMMEEKGQADPNGNYNIDVPLPTNQKAYSDTLFTDDENFSFKSVATKNKKSKYLVLRYSQYGDRNITEKIEILNRKNNLIVKRLYPDNSRDERFEYVYLPTTK